MQMDKYSILPLDQEAMNIAQRRWDSIAKPLGSLGLLEKIVVQCAGLLGTPDVSFGKKAAVVMCADNGVVAQGVTQTGSQITALVAGNLLKGESCLCRMAKLAGADVFPIDVGMLTEVPGVPARKSARGTGDITQGPAMTREQAEAAIGAGIETAKRLKEEGYGLIGAGEMGIGNTTTGSAVCAAILQKPAEEVAGRGAGLTDQGLERKIWAIQESLQVNKPNPEDGMDVLQKVGGFDIGAMAGLYIGGAVCRIPVLIDGFISAAAAIIAKKICPMSSIAMIASHESKEPAGKLALEALGKKPILCAEMRMGEGTGAVAAMPVLDMAADVYCHMSTFDDIHMESYRHLGGE